MAAFSEIMNKPANAIKPPEPEPVGEYLVVINGRYNIVDNSAAKKTDYIDFPIKVLQLGSSINPETANEWQLKTNKQLIGHEIKGRAGARFYISEDAAWMLKQFLTDTLGIPEGSNLTEMCDQAVGKQYWHSIRHGFSQDGTRMLAERASTAKA